MIAGGRFAAAQATPDVPRTTVDQAAISVRPLDDDKLAANGIRKLTSKYLILYTDCRAALRSIGFPRCSTRPCRSGPDISASTSPKPRIGRPARFSSVIAGDSNRSGCCRLGARSSSTAFRCGAELWLRDQPTPYYRRHLLLHEGTHVFMASFLGGCGPGWYMEGIAELFGTHRLDETTGELDDADHAPKSRRSADARPHQTHSRCGRRSSRTSRCRPSCSSTTASR